ncbi:hypothetical protein ACN20G_32255 (plasmid) [Streptomyces sp. BI20]|uniref:hypothetical protein n=1 Tax=Streptomyces sp. BI20 TaxID=3403460 RepID=UPI003C77D9CC
MIPTSSQSSPAHPRGRVRDAARLLCAGALGAALALGPVGAAGAAPSPKPKPSSSTSASASAKAGELTLTATPTTVKVGGKAVFTGRTKGLPIGTKVTLQHKHGTSWTTLKSETAVKKGSSFSLDYTFRTKGKEELRVKAGDAVSPTVTVTVE